MANTISDGAFQFSDYSLQMLNRRKLSQQDLADFGHILNEATSTTKDPKNFLKSLSQAELAVVQKAHSLANTININQLTTEGAANLLTQPDPDFRVDLNNDGLVEIGEAKTFSFPPPNAPNHVKEAWKEATADLNEMDKATLELRMHASVYGIQINGVSSKTPLPADIQWSTGGLQNLIATLYSQLEFSVSMEGWTESNKQFEGVINAFAAHLQTPSFSSIAKNQPLPAATYEPTSPPVPEQHTSERSREVMQLILDARLGIDREKLERLEEEIQRIANDPDIPDELKHQLIQSLQEQKEAILEQAKKLSSWA